MFQDRIRANYENLTPGFRKLADFIMNSTLDVAFLTATELSRRVGVDPATVVRFAQELDYSGFRELSREIKRYVRDQVTSTYRKAREATSTEALLLALIENANQNLRNLVTTDMSNVVKAVEILKKASRLWLTGEFTGYDLATYYAKMFARCGVPATAFQPSMAETAIIASRMEKGDVLITLAGTDPSIDAGYAVRVAKQKGLETITITGTGVVLPAREADLTIIVPSKSPAGVPAFGTLAQVLSILWEAFMQDNATASAKTAELHGNMKALLEMRASTPEYEVASLQDMWGENV